MTSSAGQEQQGTLELQKSKKDSGPVECLGLTFENEEARRDHFVALLKEKLQDPEFRKKPGFPQGSDEAILRMSDPPYYTACPNPFLKQILGLKSSENNDINYNKEPISLDINSGKSDPIYNAHTYHTKVPPVAIRKLIEHYTNPGDVVLDCFCGSGMTGVACSNRGEQNPERISILCDLSPLATHIASGITRPQCEGSSLEEIKTVISDIEREFGHLYNILDDSGTTIGVAEYIVWTECFSCSNCGSSIEFYDALLKHGNDGKLTSFPCENCGAIIAKRQLDPSLTTRFDPILERPAIFTREVPVYVVGKSMTGKKISRKGTEWDAKTAKDIDELLASCSVPVVEIPYMHMSHERNDLPGKGITHLHHFYTHRNLFILSMIWERVSTPESRFLFTSVCDRHALRRNRFIINKHNPRGRVNGPLSNTLFVPPLQVEMNVFSIFRRKIADYSKICSDKQSITSRSSFVSTQSATDLSNIDDNSIDYVFVDPPFGGNILYSDLNVIAESWLGVRTDRLPEAVVDSVRNKGNIEYQKEMIKSLSEVYKKLKPGRWMTVEFHNSSNAIWTAIQNAIGAAGFIVADVRFLDKGSGTIHQDGKASAVKKDLLISAYKPSVDVDCEFELKGPSAELAWTFMREHLANLPPASMENGLAAGCLERTPQVLLDRLIGFHVQRKTALPFTSSDFFQGLPMRFAERDGMYFLAHQAIEYDKIKSRANGIIQFNVFIFDEASAIQWLRQQLGSRPRRISEIQPDYMREQQSWSKHEQGLELLSLLTYNFLRYTGEGQVPSQIHSYLSSNYKDLRGLGKDSAALIEKALDRWYVPDTGKQADLQRLREKQLLNEFNDYRDIVARRIKTYRSEAVKAGFRDCWQKGDYTTLVKVARKLPQEALQEDLDLMMYYDNAIIRLGDDA